VLISQGETEKNAVLIGARREIEHIRRWKGADSVERHAFAAATRFFYVGIVKLKIVVQALLNEIDRCARKKRQGFVINDDFDATILENMIMIGNCLCQPDFIGPARAPGTTDAEPKPETAVNPHELLDATRGGWTKLYNSVVHWYLYMIRNNHNQLVAGKLN